LNKKDHFELKNKPIFLKNTEKVEKLDFLENMKIFF